MKSIGEVTTIICHKWNSNK